MSQVRGKSFLMAAEVTCSYKILVFFSLLYRINLWCSKVLVHQSRYQCFSNPKYVWDYGKQYSGADYRMRKGVSWIRVRYPSRKQRGQLARSCS